jgi:hypothetical protein
VQVLKLGVFDFYFIIPSRWPHIRVAKDNMLSIGYNKFRDAIMALKTLTNFKRLAIIGVAVLSFLVAVKWDIRAEPSNPYTVTVAQNETQTATNGKKTPPPKSTETESKTDEEQESTAAKKKPLKDFQPSEKIEAEQAVDFPYDI